jgi:hypothetical protein
LQYTDYYNIELSLVKDSGAVPETRPVWGAAPEKTAKNPLFPFNSGLFSQQPKFWENLSIMEFHGETRS